MFSSTVRGKNPDNVEVKWVHKNGSVRMGDVHFSLIKKEGKTIGIQAIMRDVTELDLVEEELAYERDLLHVLMNNVPDAIYFKDTESRFTRINREHARWMGLNDPAEALGKTDFDFYAEEFARQAYDDERKVLKTGEPLIGRIEKILTKDGKPRWASATKVPIKSENGHVMGIVGISRDITELKRMEEEIKRHTKHLEEIVEERTRKLKEVERLAAIGETTAMIGHDLRNPLQVIVNAVYLANRRLKELPSKLRVKGKLRELIDIIEEQTKYMDKIVSDLQEYALPLRPQSVETSLDQLVADALSAIVVPGNIKVQVKIAENCPPLQVDPRLMKKVFANLITNGLQAMPDGGYLTIEALLEDETASVIVRDTGVGMSEETLHHIFRPLFSTKPKGQGLGLAVCKRLVEAHCGNIEVSSELGKGSAFTVNIPLKRQAQQKREKSILNQP
jgi:PAS domain S-box-containing protein